MELKQKHNNKINAEVHEKLSQTCSLQTCIESEIISEKNIKTINLALYSLYLINLEEKN